MTPTPISAQLHRLGLTTGAAARLLEVQIRTVQRWVAGDVETPRAVLALLDEAERDPAVLARLREP